MKTILAAILMAVITAPSFAASGQAVIPHLDWGYSDVNNRGHTSVYMSNITDAPATVVLTLFSSSGALVADSGNLTTSGALKISGSFSSYQESPAGGGSLQFVLDAHQSAWVLIYEGVVTPGSTGYGRIEWTQDGNATSALVAHAKNYFKNSGIYSFCAIPVNQGLPF